MPEDVNSRQKDTLQEMVENINREPVHNYPFPGFIFFCNILPASLYEDASKDLPFIFSEKRNCMDNCQGSTHIQVKHGLHGKECADQVESKLKKLPATLATIEQHLNSVVRALVRKFYPEEHRTVIKQRFRWLRSLHGKGNFAMGVPHTDLTGSFSISAQIYFPVGNSSLEARRTYGTCLHRSRDVSGECSLRVPYLPNSGYAFKVSDRSFHSSPDACKYKCCSETRYVLMINIVVSDRGGGEKKKRRKKFQLLKQIRLRSTMLIMLKTSEQ